MIQSIEHTDIYLIDQILKHRFTKTQTVLDAGCGKGRNLSWFIEESKDVYGIDLSPEAINYCKERFPTLPDYAFSVQPTEQLSFESNFFDLVIANAVLHFAENDLHFESMLHELWRVVKPGGILFIRLASSHGLENHIQDIGNHRSHLPDGSDRYLVSLERMKEYTHSMNATLLEPIKTTLVENLRAMSTWVLRK